MNNFGLNDNYSYREMELDSYDALSSLTAGFPATDWPNFQISRPLNNIAAIKILEVQIPFSWYTINIYNNTFTLNGGGGPVTITIPVGNYNAESLAAALGTLMTAAGSATYTVTYSPLTQKFTIISDQISGFFTLKMASTGFTEGNFDPSVMMGMNRFNTSSTYSTGFPATLVSPNVALVTGPNYLYVNSNRIGASTNLFLPSTTEFFVGSEGLGPQMAKIPITCNPGGIVFWQDPGI